MAKLTVQSGNMTVTYESEKAELGKEDTFFVSWLLENLQPPQTFFIPSPNAAVISKRLDPRQSPVNTRVSEG